MLLSVNRLVVSYIDKCICQLNHKFLTGFTHILSVIFIKTFSIVTMLDTTAFQKQVVSEMLFIVAFNNSTGSPNKCICQFLQCIFMHMNEIAQNTFFIGNFRYKDST